MDLQKHSPGLKILTSLGGQQSWSLIIPTLHALFLITGNDQLPPSYPQLTIVSTVPTQRPACQRELEMFVINFLLSSTGCISLIVCNVKVSRWCPGDVQVTGGRHWLHYTLPVLITSGKSSLQHSHIFTSGWWPYQCDWQGQIHSQTLSNYSPSFQTVERIFSIQCRDFNAVTSFL